MCHAPQILLAIGYASSDRYKMKCQRKDERINTCVYWYKKMWHHTMCSREITCYLLLLVSVTFVDRGYTCVRSVLQCMYMSMKRRIFSLFQNESILRLILQALIKQAQQIINMFQSFMNLKRTEICSVVRLLSFNRYLYHKIHFNILCICFKH